MEHVCKRIGRVSARGSGMMDNRNHGLDVYLLQPHHLPSISTGRDSTNTRAKTIMKSMPKGQGENETRKEASYK